MMSIEDLTQPATTAKPSAPQAATRPGGRLVRRLSNHHGLGAPDLSPADALDTPNKEEAKPCAAVDDDYVVGEPPEICRMSAREPNIKATAQGGDISLGMGRSPSAAAERNLVGAILSDNDLFDTVNTELRSEDFGDPSASAAFLAVTDILEGRVDGVQIADAVTVSVSPGISRFLSMGELDGWARDAPTTEVAVRSRMQVVMDAARKRKLTAAVVKAQVVLGEEHRPLNDRAADIGQLLAEGEESRRLQVKSLGDFAIEAMTELVEASRSGTTVIGVPTSFRDLDALLAGLQPSQLIVLAARPSVGKSALAMCIGLHAASCGYQTVMVSLEMGGTELGKRAISVVTGVDAARLRIGALSEEEWGQAMVGAEQLKAIPFVITDLPTVDIGTMKSMCRKLYREGQLKLLIVDYLQIMAGNPKLSREQQISEISRGLKEIAKELKIPVLALSQLSRKVEDRTDKRPLMSDLRESGAIEQDADVIIFIHRDEVNNKGTVDKGVAEIIVAKQRSGATGSCRVQFQKVTTKFLDFELTRSYQPPLESIATEIADPLSDLLPAMRNRTNICNQ